MRFQKIKDKVQGQSFNTCLWFQQRKKDMQTTKVRNLGDEILSNILWTKTTGLWFQQRKKDTQTTKVRNVGDTIQLNIL